MEHIECRDTNKFCPRDGHKINADASESPQTAGYASCFYCGGDQQIAEIAKRMGHRPDVAFAKVREVKRQSEKLYALYHRVNELMAVLGADGEINATQDVAENVMSALADIDGGQYDIKLGGR